MGSLFSGVAVTELLNLVTEARNWMQRNPLQARSLKAWSSINKKPKRGEKEPRSNFNLPPNSNVLTTCMRSDNLNSSP